MLQTKSFEIRDAGTFIPAVGILCDPTGEGVPAEGHEGLTKADRYLLGRAGYRSSRCVIFTRLDADGNTKACYDPYSWPAQTRTMRVAHDYITKHWDELPSGAVVDVEFILNIRDRPKKSEAAEW